jgi:hypothetical protein
MKLSVCLDGNNGTFGARMRKISVLIGIAAKAELRPQRKSGFRPLCLWPLTTGIAQPPPIPVSACIPVLSSCFA